MSPRELARVLATAVAPPEPSATLLAEFPEPPDDGDIVELVLMEKGSERCFLITVEEVK